MLAAFLILGLLSVCFAIPFYSRSYASTLAPPSSGVSLVNTESFNDYGQFAVNDTLTVGSNSSSSVSAVTFGYPLNYNGHIFAEQALENGGPLLLSSANSGSSVNNQSVEITVNLPSALSGQSPGNVSLRFYVVGTYSSLNSSSSSCSTCYYRVPMLLFPSVSFPSSGPVVDTAQSNITFPNPTVTDPSTNSTAAGSEVARAGFGSQTTSNFFRLYNTTRLSSSSSGYLDNVHWANVTVGSGSSSGGLVDFLNVQRSFSVSLGGSLVVTDSILVRNLGPNTLSSLGLNLLTGPNTTSVTIEPTGQPLLSNAVTTTVSSGAIDILSASGQTIESNATLQVVVQYPLGQQYWSYSGGKYTASLPQTVPVAGVVDQFQTSYSVPSGYVVTASPKPLNIANTTGQSAPATLAYIRGVGFAYGYVLPISAVMFLGVLIAALVFKPRGGKKKEEIETTLTSLIKAAEDKVSGTNEVLSELKSRGTSVNKTDLSTARVRIEELRSRSVGRFGTIRTELGAASTSSQVALAQAATDDREFDRAVRDLLSVYDQLISRRIKPESFGKAQRNNERRIQRITNTLLDDLQDLRRDYEQEQ